MKFFLNVIILFIFLILLSFRVLFGQPLQIKNVISEKASSKLQYQLAIAAIFQKNLAKNKYKNTQAIDQYKQRLKSMSSSIVVSPDQLEPTVNVLIKMVKGFHFNEKYFINYKLINLNKYSYVTANVFIKDLEKICDQDQILEIEPSMLLNTTLDDSSKDIKANYIWFGGSIRSSVEAIITGKNVIVGIIDSKPNFRHFTFLDKYGKSRFLEDYDQRNPQEHGSHVAGIIAGRGALDHVDNSNKNRGIAWESNLIWREAKNTTTTIEQFTEMIEFSKDKPLVVNYSQGVFSGPRDGTTLFEEALDEMISGNKIFIASAGNQSTLKPPYPHYSGFVPSQKGGFLEFEFLLDKVNVKKKNVTIEIWHKDQFDIQISNNKTRWSDTIKFGYTGKFGVNQNDTIDILNLNSNNNNETSVLLNNANKSKVIVINFDSKSKDSIFVTGTYTIKLYPHLNNTGGSFNAFSDITNMPSCGFPLGDNYQSLATPGFAKNVITVAAYRKECDGGNWAPYSSLGPSGSDSGIVSKPDISAPGGLGDNGENKNAIWSASNTSLYGWKPMSGTSMAAPHVTGAIALLMQCFPQLTAIQVKEILQKSAGAIPSGTLTFEDRKYWGAGKLDILAAFKSMAGFSYIRPYSYSENSYKLTFYECPDAGLPFGPVVSNWEKFNYSYQKFTNGAIFSNNTDTFSNWIGEGIWKKWIDLGSVQSKIGLPQSSEFIDGKNNNYPTVKFENGKIYWDGSEAKILYYIQPKFIADVTEGNIPLTIHFSDLTNNDNGEIITSWSWDFGDGTISTEQNPVHVYTKTGVFDVTLTVQSNFKNYSKTAVNFITTFSNYSPTNITMLEYFFDTDPGLGKATPIFLSASPYANIQTNISLENVTPGLHRLYFRAKDEKGKWSTVYSKPILVTTETSNTPITKLEYFIDNQNPDGSGNVLNISSSKDITFAENINLSKITPGLHRIYFKAQDGSGKWSTIHSKPLLITTEESATPIKKIEYFFDNLNLTSSNNFLNFTPSQDVNLIQNISLSNVSPGLHRLYIRAQDGSGKWSTVHSKPLLVNNSLNTLPDITQIEYFIDQDPGLLKGKALPFTTGSDITVNSNIPLNTFAYGSHNIYFQAKDSRGIWSLPQFSTFSIVKNKSDFPFKSGWNIFSSNILPDNQNLKDIFQPLIDAGKLKKVMDESGKAIENFGALGGWKNNIGNVNQSKGYKVNVTGTDTLSIEGPSVDLPMDIKLTTGWNIISYPCSTLQDAQTLVQPLIDAGMLKKIMDETGKSIEDFGINGGWKNNIGNFMQGKGFKVYVTAPCTLTITASGIKSASIIHDVMASKHFTTVFEGNGTDHMNIHMVKLEASGIQVGDEIGVFDGKYCVGAATVGADQLMAGSISIPSSCNDGLAETLNGFTTGHPVELQLYRANQTYKLKTEKIRGNELFEKNGSLFVKATLIEQTSITVGSTRFYCYPNPFIKEVTIEIQNASQTDITIEIYNIFGQRIKNIFKGINKGHMMLKWNGTNDLGDKVIKGVYFCKINNQTQKVVFEGGN